MGGTETSDEVYLVIDALVHGGEQVHRFLYTTNPVYLLFPLPLLNIFSFGGLAPPSAYERVT